MRPCRKMKESRKVRTFMRGENPADGYSTVSSVLGELGEATRVAACRVDGRFTGSPWPGTGARIGGGLRGLML